MGKITFQFIVLLKRLAILLLLYSSCRLFFFVMYKEFFSGSLFTVALTFLSGLRFDVAAVIMINFIFIIMHLVPFNFFNSIFYQKILRFLFYIFNIPALALNILDIGYF